MKEKFDNRRLFGAINVKCKNDDGSFRTWNVRKEDVVENIVNIVERYEAMGYRLTLRQLHYQLVSANQIVNHQTAYKKLGTILDDCRYAGIIDWDNIEDRGRALNYPYFEYGIPQALQRTVDAYRLERQLGQPAHIEVWTEKDALSAIFNRSTYKYGIGLCVNKGYTSSSAIYRAYQRFLSVFLQGRRVVVLYFGDHDPSGLDMVRDIRERLEFMFQNGECEGTEMMDWIEEGKFEVAPIGLNMQQIKRYNLPPNPAKLTDSRSDAYIKKHGKMSWEVDALRPEILTEIVEANIEENMDMDVFEEILEKEKTDIQKLKNIIKKHK